MKKTKKQKTKVSLIALAIIIILLALFKIFEDKLSTSDAQFVNNLGNLKNNLINSVFTNKESSILESITNIISSTNSTSNTENSTTNTSTTTISETSYKVVRVVDGDTIIIDYNGKEERIRMIGIDTPESVHPDAKKNTEFGKEASDFTKKNLTDKYVKIELDVQERDKYGRLLAYVYLDDKMYNKTLLEEGYAKISTYPPNVKYAKDFTSIQEQARNAKKGLWSYTE